MTDITAHRVPGLLPAVAAFAAVLAASATGIGEALTAAAAALGVLYIFRNYRSAVPVFAGTFALVSVCTIWLAPHPLACGEMHRYGIVAERVVVGEKSQRVVGRLTGIDGRVYPSVRIMLTVTDICPLIHAGDSVIFSGELSEPGRYSNIPHMEPATLHERAERISAGAVVIPEKVAVTGRSDAVWYGPDRLRERLCEAIHSSSLSPEAARLLEASTLGGELDKSARDDFRGAGISHLLCVSGFHVGVVGALVWFLLMPLTVSTHLRRLRIPLVLAVVWAYALVAGCTPSVIRAAVMLSAYYLAGARARTANSINALCVAFAVVLVVSPWQLYSAGFQLSFAAVTGLLLLSWPLNPVSTRHPGLHTLAGLLTAPLAASMATLPVIIWNFHRVSALTIPVNALAVFVFPVFMLGGAIVVLCDAAGMHAQWLTDAVDHFHNAMMHGIGVVADISTSLSPDFSGNMSMVMLLVGALAALTVLVHNKERRTRLVSGAACIGCVAAAGCVPDAHPSSGIYFDSVGRSTVVHTVAGGEPRCFLLEGLAPRHNALSHYYAAYGFFEPDVAVHDCMGESFVDISSTGVCIASEEVGREADVLFVGKTYRGRLGALLSAVKPRLVVLSGLLDRERRRAYAAECAMAGIECADLTQRAAGYIPAAAF